MPSASASPTPSPLLAPVARWTHARKMALCAGLHAGTITARDARLAHRLEADELNKWYLAWRRLNGMGPSEELLQRCRASTTAAG